MGNILLIALIFVLVLLLITVLVYLFICKRYIRTEKDLHTIKDEETETSGSSRIGISSDAEAHQKLVNP